MTERTVVRGDDYVMRRPVFKLTLVAIEGDVIVPLDMSGCTVRATFKTAPTDPATDPTDESAELKRDITFDVAGTVTSATGFRLPDGGTAQDGVLWLTATSSDTLALPLATTLKGDVQVTDANDEVLTVFSTATLKAVEGYTNRTGD